MQIVFQDPYGSLNPRRRVGSIIGDPFDIHGLARGHERVNRVQELMELVGLNPEHYNRFPGDFSGGPVRTTLRLPRARLPRNRNPRSARADRPRACRLRSIVFFIPEENTMKRILSLVAVLGALALVTTTMSLASQRATRHAGALKAPVAGASGCTAKPGASCPGGCPLCDSNQAAATQQNGRSAQAMTPANASGTCPVSDPSACPSNCQRSGAGGTAAALVR